MNWNVLDSTAHKRPDSPVPSSSAPGTAPTSIAGRPPRAASHSHRAPVSKGTKDENDHHWEVMDSRTALSSRLFFSRCLSLIEQTFPTPRWPRPDHSRPSRYPRRRGKAPLFVLDGLDDAFPGGGAGGEETGEDAYEEAGKQGRKSSWFRKVEVYLEAARAPDEAIDEKRAQRDAEEA